MIDTWPAWFRHLFLLVVPVALGWAGSDVIPGLRDRSPILGAMASAALVAIVAWVTPLTRQYGVGASDGPTLTRP